MPTLAVTIANNTNQSTSVDLSGLCLVGIHVPTGFDGTALTFQTSLDDATYVDVNVNGTAYQITVAAAKYEVVDYTKFLGVRFLKITSGTTQSPAAVLTLAARNI